MKQKNFLKIAVIFFFTFFSNNSINAQSTGDIAFVGFNYETTEGDKDFSIIILDDLAANSTIYITDNEPNGSGGFTSGEGALAWTSPSTIIKSGTIVVFSDVNNDTIRSVSVGSVTEPDAGFNPTDKDGLFIYTGTDEDTVTTFIFGLRGGNDVSETGDLTGTNLVEGTSFVVIDNSASPDGGFYSGSKSNQASYSNYLPLICDKTNWTTTTGNGETLTIPFSQEAFTIITTNWTGTSSTVWNLAGNWDNGIPTSNSLAVIPEVGTAPIISTTATVGNLTITESDGVTLSSGGSLIVNGTSSGNLTYNRTLTYDADITKSWHLVSSPVSGEIMTDMISNNSFLTNGSNEISFTPYDNSQAVSDDRWSYFGNTATDALENGKGYSTKLSAAGDISFTGTINNSDVAIALTLGSGGSGNDYNLLGNPFTASINSGSFLTSNTSELSQEEIYVWHEASEQYLTKTSGINFKVSPGQGFFVEALSTNNVTFSKSIQSHETDNFQKSSSTEIKLNITDGSLTRFADIYYIDGTTKGFDNGFDGKLFGGVPQPFALYTHLVSESNGDNFQIQSLPNSNLESMIIPIGLNATIGKEITFSAEALNLPSEIKVFLEDRLSNTFTRLDVANSNYKLILTETLNGVGRFYLHTAQSALSTDYVILNSVSIYKTNASTLKIAGLPQGKTSISLYNILGKEMMSTSFTSNGNKEISLSKLSTGIYLAKVETEKGVISKKSF